MNHKKTKETADLISTFFLFFHFHIGTEKGTLIANQMCKWQIRVITRKWQPLWKDGSWSRRILQRTALCVCLDARQPVHLRNHQFRQAWDINHNGVKFMREVWMKKEENSQKRGISVLSTWDTFYVTAKRGKPASVNAHTCTRCVREKTCRNVNFWKTHAFTIIHLSKSFTFEIEEKHLKKEIMNSAVFKTWPHDVSVWLWRSMFVEFSDVYRACTLLSSKQEFASLIVMLLKRKCTLKEKLLRKTLCVLTIMKHSSCVKKPQPDKSTITNRTNKWQIPVRDSNCYPDWRSTGKKERLERSWGRPWILPAK